MLPPWPNAAPPRTRLGRERGCHAGPVAASAPEVAGPPAADAGDHDVSVEREQVLAPPRGNGHDNGAELLEIPAFLRRG